MVFVDLSLAHAGEEGLYILVPALLFLIAVNLVQRRRQARGEKEVTERDGAGGDPEGR